MDKLVNICKSLLEGKMTPDALRREAKTYDVYPRSIYRKNDLTFFMVKKDRIKYLIVVGEGSQLEDFEGKYLVANKCKICPLNYINSKILRDTFPFTAPVSSRGHKTTLGLGDRLGLASIGHIKLIRDYDVFPILAQQSIRELTLTGRSYNDVLDAATWSVFQENYQSGYGADGDHLKTIEEVKMALDCGFSMITLDCSEHLDSSANQLTNLEVMERYSQLDNLTRSQLERKYLKKTFSIGENVDIYFEEVDFKRTILIYLDAIRFATRVYNSLISKMDREIDFEISIDETSFSTSINAHFLIASELIGRGVKVNTIAPRFYGEFQKGIDYIGDKEEFYKNVYLHSTVANYFGYKISVHSGSDKFKIFPIIGEITNDKYHLKTAGTNWLEGMRVISVKDRSLFREIFKFAMDNLNLARAYYHINGDPEKLPLLEDIDDNELANLLDNDDARQILHITYGLILQEIDEHGKYVFKDKIYNILNDFEDDYDSFLYRHIGKHLQGLQLKKTR